MLPRRTTGMVQLINQRRDLTGLLHNDLPAVPLRKHAAIPVASRAARHPDQHCKASLSDHIDSLTSYLPVPPELIDLHY